MANRISLVNACVFALGLIVAQAHAATQGVTDTEVKVGAHTSESGKMAIYAPGPRAVSAYFDKVNEKGGVNGRKIKFVRIDSQGEHIKSMQATKKIVEEDKIFAMVHGQGASHQAVYKYLIEKNIPDVFFTDGLREYTTPLKKSTFPGQASFYEEARTYANHALSTQKGKQACFLVTDNTMGEDFLDGAKKTLEEGNKKLPAAEQMKIGVTERADRLAAQANGQILNLKKAGCEVVFTSMYSGLAPNAMTYAQSQGFMPKWYVLTLNVTPKFIELLPESIREGVVSSLVTAASEDFKTPGWTEFKATMDANNIPISRSSASGWMIAEMFVEALKKTGKDLTSENFIKTLESFNWKCSICLAPATMSATNHWPFQQPVLVISKGGKWLPL